MKTKRQKSQILLAAFAMLIMVSLQSVFAQQQNEVSDQVAPQRIGMVSGSASFWRPGAQNWSSAQINTPLAAGDALYTTAGATLEVQIGGRAYLRMGQNAMLTVLSEESNLQQFKVTSGIVAFDLRNMVADRAIELDTPAGAFSINSAGYYRVEVSDNATHFIVRRGGEATVTLPNGESRLIAPSQEVVIEPGDGQKEVETYVAPNTDAWDNWNYTRTDDLIDAVSNRYVSSEVYGTDDLDHNGNWRVTPDYGPVWFPAGVTQDWAPYSSGSWVWDPVYTWTWVDTAPWGWAPYHYGRWVNVNGLWAWAPGPRAFHPAYSPALVAFFHTGGGTVQTSFGGPGVSWVALSWGEPLLPWWGRQGFVGRPWWGGWSGPRVVNNVVIQHNTVINNVTNINYRNFNHRNAVIAVREDHFGRGRVSGAMHFEPGQAKGFTPIVGRSPLRPNSGSFVPAPQKVAGPNRKIFDRPAVALHNPPPRAEPWKASEKEAMQSRLPGMPSAPQENRVITVRPQANQAPAWASPGKAGGEERNESRRPLEPPRVDAEVIRSTPTVREKEMPKPTIQQPATQQPAVQQPAVQQPMPPAMQPVAPPQLPAPQHHQQEAARNNHMPAPVHREPAASMPNREMQQMQRQERQERSRNEVRSEAPRQLPGQPANQLYRQHHPQNEQRR